MLDREIEHANISCVLLDNQIGMNQEMDAILETNPGQIHLVNGPIGNHDAVERRKVVVDRANAEGITVREWEGKFTKRSGIRAASDLLEVLEEGDAIICLNDDMALGVYDVMQNSSFRIGEDISLVGFDKLEITNYTQPRIASVSYSKSEWGKKAARALLHLIEEKENMKETIPSKFVKDASIRKNNKKR